MKRKLMLVCVLAVAATSVSAASAQAAAPARSQDTTRMQLRASGFWKAFDCALAVAAFAVAN